MAVPNRIRERLQHGLRRMVPIIQQQKARDVSEADTVTLVKDTLAEVFGYDKYSELTSEHAIRGTYCDLAVKLAGKLVQLIEVKSAGSVPDNRHVRQAIDYAGIQRGAIPRLLLPQFIHSLTESLMLPCRDYRRQLWTRQRKAGRPANNQGEQPANDWFRFLFAAAIQSRVR